MQGSRCVQPAHLECWQRPDAPCTSSVLPAVAALSARLWLVGSIGMIITSLDERIADVAIAPHTPSVTEPLAFPGHSGHVNAGATSRFGGNITSASASRSMV